MIFEEKMSSTSSSVLFKSRLKSVIESAVSDIIRLHEDEVMLMRLEITQRDTEIIQKDADISQRDAEIKMLKQKLASVDTLTLHRGFTALTSGKYIISTAQFT